MANKRGRGRKPSLAARLADGLLTGIDLLCRGVSSAAVFLLRGIAKGLFALAKLLLRLAGGLVWLAGWPFRRLLRALLGRHNRAERCLRLTGEEFEDYCAQVLADNGFRHVELTPMGGDQGVDILAVREGESWAIQCKNYAGAVGNFAVQEAYAGREFYGCDRAAVLCPGEYTKAARELAASTDVELWDGRVLSRMMKRSGRVPHRASP